MASVMAICGGLLGPKGENVEELLVFKVFGRDKGCNNGQKTNPTTEKKHITRKQHEGMLG